MQEITLGLILSGKANLGTWVEILKGLLTPTVAVAAVVVARQQLRIHRMSFKNSQFERRLGVMAGAMDAALAAGMGTPSRDVYTKYIAETGFAHLYGFSDSLLRYLKEEMKPNLREIIDLHLVASRTQEQEQRADWLKRWFQKQVVVQMELEFRSDLAIGA